MKKLREILFLQNLKGITKKSIYDKYWQILSESKGIKELKEKVLETNTNLLNEDIESAFILSKNQYDNLRKQKDIKVITVFDKAYPSNLNVMNDKRPLIIYAKGNTRLLSQSNVAIVGTRNPSDMSMQVEEKLVRKILSLSNRVIVSGLALGCDKIAHETALKVGKKTLAVLPSGLNAIVPSSNIKLADEIVKKKGCLITEYGCDVKVENSLYIERDGVLAALSDMTFVVECDIKSGTMHTVDAARKYKKQVCCYYPSKVQKGTYEGNKYIVEKRGGIKVMDTPELRTVLDNNKAITMKQPSLVDYL